MKAAAPSISVIIPVRNGAGFVASALGTIAAQRQPNLEVLLIDDGSTDDLAERLAEHQARCPDYVRCLRQEPLGQASARNHGIRKAKGDLIAFLDIDDLWSENHLTTLSRALEEDAEAGIAQGMMRQFWSASDGKCYGTALYRMPYLGSCLFRRSVFNLCGLFDERMPFGEDYDFMFRCWENDVVKVNIPKLSLLYRRHARNMSRGRNRTAHLLVLKRRIERIKAGIINPAFPRRFVFQDYIGDQVPGREISLREVVECDLR
jgi:glycosyltransferase involved in cell wall biosynthesis